MRSLISKLRDEPSRNSSRLYGAGDVRDFAILPLTENGKVDRKALPASGFGEHSRARYTGARNPTEEILVGIWADVLGRQRVGIYDNFFELGGHSLLATQVISRLRKSFQIELPLRRLFEAPTPAELAEVDRSDIDREPRGDIRGGSRTVLDDMGGRKL